MIGHRDIFFRTCFASFHTHASLLIFFVCFFILFDSCCSHARVFEKTLAHELPISCSHTEWYVFYAKRDDRRVACQKLTIIIMKNHCHIRSYLNCLHKNSALFSPIFLKPYNSWLLPHTMSIYRITRLF